MAKRRMSLRRLLSDQVVISAAIKRRRISVASGMLACRRIQERLEASRQLLIGCMQEVSEMTSGSVYAQLHTELHRSSGVHESVSLHSSYSGCESQMLWNWFGSLFCWTSKLTFVLL